jgi:hypothetical protein
MYKGTYHVDEMLKMTSLQKDMLLHTPCCVHSDIKEKKTKKIQNKQTKLRRNTMQWCRLIEGDVSLSLRSLPRYHP